MQQKNIFPAQAFTESMSESAVKLEGHRVVFDKKVSLLPVDIRKQGAVKGKKSNGRS
jgi:hypothetical protein